MNQLFLNEPNELKYITSVKGVITAPVITPTAKLYVTSNRANFPITSYDLEVSSTKAGEFFIKIPSNLIEGYKLARVEFSYTLLNYGPVIQKNIYEISQRLVTYSEYSEFMGEDIFGVEYEEGYPKFEKTESIVRNVIESYCNQKFNFWEGSQRLYGTSSFIMLPQHMEKLDSVYEDLDAPTAYVSDYESSLFKLSNSGYAITQNSSFLTPTAIYQPNETNTYFNVTGQWGWQGIPEDIKRGAMQLIQYFSTDKISARYRYLVNSTSSNNESFSFSFDSFKDSTGNPVVDDILSNYRLFAVSAI